MVGSLGSEQVILAIIVGTLAAIVYSLRVLLILERRVAGMEANIQRMTARVLREEVSIMHAVKKPRKGTVKSSSRTTSRRKK